MKKKLLVFSTLCLILGACERVEMTKTGKEVTESAADRVITQNIRQALNDDDSLSANAKNIKMTTNNGVVTLRGIVNSEREKAEVGNKAKAVIGVKSVDNQLEVKTIEVPVTPRAP